MAAQGHTRQNSARTHTQAKPTTCTHSGHSSCMHLIQLPSWAHSLYPHSLYPALTVSRTHCIPHSLYPALTVSALTVSQLPSCVRSLHWLQLLGCGHSSRPVNYVHSLHGIKLLEHTHSLQPLIFPELHRAVVRNNEALHLNPTEQSSMPYNQVPYNQRLIISAYDQCLIISAL